ncbi:AraC family transcriptional regulator [Microbacterium sp. cx-59]|uniref:helix-turn-helix transcriptional regulator n=1 Tax=Microbacterium sp. cx-59 TaxID=2891207 RepID=UPI001E2F0D33|nr:AraC family transcriptional regulator [Microbacterium sp. cx-59]MCC4909423.1 AraC family transcriptional regulator [Microbacterium sp. cx-59]
MAPASFAVRNASMEEAESVGAQVFHRHTLRPLDTARPPRLTLTSYRAGPVTLGTVQYSAGARVESGSVPGAYQINIPLTGTLRTGRPGEQMLATGLRAAQYGLHPHGFEGFETPTRVLGIKIDSAALESRLESLLGRRLGGAHIEFALEFPLTSPAARDWFAVVQLLARRLWGPSGLGADPVVRDGLQEALMAGLLVASPHAFRDELAHPGDAAGPGAIRRAIAYVDSSPTVTSLAVPELAAVVGVSVRALQIGFRRALDTTPLAYLRQRRLTLARRELERASAPEISVAQIADRCGFAHHGRFATDYRRRFGESPVETLRRG